MSVSLVMHIRRWRCARGSADFHTPWGTDVDKPCRAPRIGLNPLSVDGLELRRHDRLAVTHKLTAAHPSPLVSEGDLGDEMNEESNKSLVRRYFDEVWVRGDVAVLHELFVPGSLLVGAAEANIAMMRPAFSDIRATVDDLVAEGDKVAVHVSFSGDNTGPLLGFPPTGKMAVLSALYLFTFENGRIRTMVFETDLFGLMMALGLIQLPPAATLPPNE